MPDELIWQDHLSLGQPLDTQFIVLGLINGSDHSISTRVAVKLLSY